MTDAVEQDWSDLPWIGGMPIPVPRGHPEYRAPKTPRYPQIGVQLTGEDGNAYAIVGAVVEALKAAGLDRDTISQFRDEAMLSDYDDLRETCAQWVTVS
jgi:hypothetical protein